MQWSRERCKINLIIGARDYNNTMVVNYIYIVLQSHWKGFGMYSFFYILFWRHSVYVYVCIMYIYVCVCVCIWYAVCACVYLYIYIYMCVCVCVYIYIYTYEPFTCIQGDVFFIGSDISNLTMMRFEISLLMGGNARLFKSFEFGNGSRMSDENLVMLEFKYLQNKKW